MVVDRCLVESVSVPQEFSDSSFILAVGDEVVVFGNHAFHEFTFFLGAFMLRVRLCRQHRHTVTLMQTSRPSDLL